MTLVDSPAEQAHRDDLLASRATLYSDPRMRPVLDARTSVPGYDHVDADPAVE